MNQHKLLMAITFVLCCWYLHLQAMMFYHVSAFNQDIGGWDVSNSEDFVSIAVNVITYIYIFGLS